jgi:hypothetical protein
VKNEPEQMELFWIALIIQKAGHELFVHELRNQAQQGSMPQLWIQIKKS